MSEFLTVMRRVSWLGLSLIALSMISSLQLAAQGAAAPDAATPGESETSDAGFGESGAANVDGANLLDELPPEIQALQREWDSIPWELGPTIGAISNVGKIELPEGYRFTGAAGAQKLLELYGNPPDDSILAAIEPLADDQAWTLIFEFDEIGYVKDDEKDTLNAEELIQGFRDTIPAQNEFRRQYNSAEITDMSWSVRPFYDEQTNNLTWGLKLDTTAGASINYDIRILGRRGVMNVTLLDAPETFQQSVPIVDELLTGYSFTEGNKYAEWQAGDKVAAYGLTGLVAGGAAVAAAKTGLLGKLGVLLAKGGKLLIVGAIAVLVAIKSFFSRMFGRREESDQMSA